MSEITQRSFSGGELAPALRARVDTTKYATGASIIKNFIIMKHGGAISRPGTTLVAEMKDSSTVARLRLIPFVFDNTDQSYVLEFGDQYMRVYRLGAQVLTSVTQSITGISKASQAVVTYSGADTYANGDEVYITGVAGMTEVNGRNFLVSDVDTGANTFKLKDLYGNYIVSTNYTTYSSVGSITEVYKITTPYTSGHLADLHFVQSADTITIVHPSYAVRELTRTDHNAWTLATVTFGAGIAAPSAGWAFTDNTSGTGSQATHSYAITSVDTNGDESTRSTSQATSADLTLTLANILKLDWTAVSGAVKYNVYKAGGGTGAWGYLVTTEDSDFDDIGLTPDMTDLPPTAVTVFNSSSNYPSTVAYIQQRRVFANSTNDPEKVWMSKTGIHTNFNLKLPLLDDAPITFTLSGQKINRVKHLLDLGEFILLTESGELVIRGNESGVITPTGVNPKQISYNGCNNLQPILVDNVALYVQANGNLIRDIGNKDGGGITGEDLTVFSSHLFEGYEILDWAYQKTPNSVVWCVRDDGVLISLTYIREHQIWAWTRHETDGDVENVCVVRENNEDVLYMIVKRTIDGLTGDRRYLERMVDRFILDDTEIKDFIGMDCTLTYDGRHTGSTTMTLSGGTNWLYSETLTLTASASTFTSAYVGNEIHLTGSDGTVIRFEIIGYTGVTVVTGRAHKTVPASMRSVAISTWAYAVDRVTGLWNLEGQDVAVFADGFVVANPNNPDYTVRTVSSGALDLDDCYSVVHVGLPYYCDLQTLDIDTPQGTLANKQKKVDRVVLHLEKSLGVYVGPKAPDDDDDDPLQYLNELKIRTDEDSMELPTPLYTGTKDVTIEGHWNSNGRVFIRQIDPLPVSVLAVTTEGMFSGGGQ